MENKIEYMEEALILLQEAKPLLDKYWEIKANLNTVFFAMQEEKSGK